MKYKYNTSSHTGVGSLLGDSKMEEPKPQPRAYFIDLYSKEYPLKYIFSRLTDLITESENIAEHHVIFMMPTSNEHRSLVSNSKLQERNDVSFHPLCNESRIESFYEAKEQVDDKKIQKVAIVCFAEQSGYWKQLGDLFFTKVYQWSVDAIGDGRMELTAIYGLECEVSQFLQNLPSNGEIKVLRSPLIPNNVFNHGFTTRSGGISSVAPLRSLNLMYTMRKRDPAIVINENRRRLAVHAGFNVMNFQLAKAEHGNRVWVIGNDVPSGYDAIVTHQNELVVAAPGADCVTIIFADPVHKVCGSAHAGWRGTLKGIGVETVRAMVREFNCKAEDILVAMGPSLETSCLQFSPEDAVGFQKIDSTIVVSKAGDPKVYVDLLKANRVLLEREGIKTDHIDISLAMCTACNPDSFFSFRRDKFPFGNQIAFIGLK